jgi:predicted CopG family antitoxin
MGTTIQISRDLLETLKQRKFNEKESYEEVIWDLIEDTQELSEETKRDLAEARAEVKAGKIHKWEDIKKDLKLHV